jgi:hypothetical protein
MVETTRKRRAAVAGLPRALLVARAHGGGAPASGKASMGAAGLGEPPGVVGLARGCGALE